MMRAKEEVLGILITLFSIDEKPPLQTKLRGFDICEN